MTTRSKASTATLSLATTGTSLVRHVPESVAREASPRWPLHGVETLAELFAWRVAATPEAPAYRDFDTGAGRWRSISWREVSERTARFAAALAALRLQRGARVALLLPNGVETVCIDQAVLAAACVPVPMHALDNPASIAYVLADSEASVLFAASPAQWRAVLEVGIEMPALRWVIVPRRDAITDAPRPQIVPIDEWLAMGTQPMPAGRAAVQAPHEEELAALIYTSGTTGRPKGVMLTHANVIANVRACLQRIAPREDDLFLSFLPLSHTFERTVGYYLPMAVGCCVAYARSVADLPEDMRSVKPTVLVSVPRIYERMHVQTRARLSSSRWRESLFQWAVDVGWRRFCRTQRLHVEGTGWAALDALAWPLLDRWVGAPLRERFGGRLRIAVSGGAPLSFPIARCFLGLGVPIVQGYGMTETSPVVSANAPDDNDPATVGRPLPGVDVRIGEQQELLVRAPSVMQGYLKRPGDTLQAFTEGWLRTGDQASIEEGRIRVLGRLKEIIVTTTGEKIAPGDLEQAIVADPLFEQVFVFGEARPFIACIVVLSGVHWTQFATKLKLDPLSPASLSAPESVEVALKRIHAQTAPFPRHGQPRKVALTLAPWTVENTLLTPTLKLKRRNLEAHFAPLIERLYDER